MGCDRRNFIRLAAGLTATALLPAGCVTGRDQQAAASYHHWRGRFRNPPGSPQPSHDRNAWQAFQSRMMATFDQKIPPPPGHVLPPAEALARLNALGGRPSLTWLGHASFLVRLGDRNILLDPFLSDSAGPLPALSVPRSVPPGLSLNQLPPIDVVIISHNHYDHLDAPTIDALPGKSKITAVVPLGLGSFFYQRGYTDVRELDWYGFTEVGSIKVTALPAIHRSRRGLNDMDETLWAGFALAGPGFKLYFSGDTALGPVFDEIGRGQGPFDLGLIAIGAYEPRELMRPFHASPEDAVIIGRRLGCRQVMGHHWGTIKLSDESPYEAGPRFRRAALAAGYVWAEVWETPIGGSLALKAGAA